MQKIPSEKPAPESLHADDLIYRCACGNEVLIEPGSVGRCEKCSRIVSNKVLSSDLAATITISGSFSDINRKRVADDDQFDPQEFIGKKYGHYEIIKPLGRGGSGFVYLALDNSLQRYVAVKILKSTLVDKIRADGRSEVDLLLEEAVAQARVAHPNIVSIYFVGMDQDQPFYAMELVDGFSLSERLAAGDMEFSTISGIAEDIVRALKFSHELDVIHGDIKPSNILLSKTSGAKLSDFGLARRASDKQTLVTGGTPNYLAPEILFGETPSVQSDMYALGVTLFEMTFGKLPIQVTGLTVADWQQCHQSQNVEFPEDWPENLPPEWMTFLQQLLATDPAARFQNYTDLSNALSRLHPTGNVVASPLPRMIATLIDWLVVILFMLPFHSLIVADRVELSRWLQAAFYLLDFVPILTYTATLFLFKQSVGRQLMQLRVLNRFGMVPKGRKIVLRSLLRMIVPWVMAVLLVVAIFPSGIKFGNYFVMIIGGATALYLLATTTSLLITKRHRCIHDYLLETQVVIDS